MLNDADILTQQFEHAADLVAHGVCPICEDALDVYSPRFDNDRRWNGGNALQNRANRAMWAKLLGPVAPDGTHHQICLDAPDF